MSHILYDTFVHGQEWEPDKGPDDDINQIDDVTNEPDVVAQREKQQLSKKRRRCCGKNKDDDTVPKNVGYELHPEWIMKQSPNGEYILVLQETRVAIREKINDFGKKEICWEIPEDPSPRLRHVTWNLECTLVAISSSTGIVSVYDLTGRRIHEINTSGKSEPVIGEIMGLAYRQSDCSHKRFSKCSELLILDRFGGVQRIHTPKGLDDPLHNHESETDDTQNDEVGLNSKLNLDFQIPGSENPRRFVGLSHDHKTGVLAVFGPNFSPYVDSRKGPEITTHVSFWNLLDKAPWLKKIGGTKPPELPPKKGIFGNMLEKCKSRDPNEVTMLLGQTGAFSPNGSLLSTCDLHGNMVVWTVPKCEVVHSIKGFNEKQKQVNDISWWSDSVLIRSNRGGEVVVCPLRQKSLKAPSVEATAPEHKDESGDDTEQDEHGDADAESNEANNDSEVDGQIEMEDNGSMEHEEKEELNEVEEFNLLGSEPERFYGIPLLSDAILDENKKNQFFVLECMTRYTRRRQQWTTSTDAMKNEARCQRTFRLVSISQTTPMAMLRKKILAEEYGEALGVARCYGLDTDLVYQNHWKHKNVTEATIRGILNKIHDSEWVLEEIKNRATRGAESMEMLLKYGLKKTDLKPEARPNSEDISPDMKRRIGYRMIFLRYLDRLRTYKEMQMIGHSEHKHDVFDGKESSSETEDDDKSGSGMDQFFEYNSEEYMKFRTCDLFEEAVDYTHMEHFERVAILLKYHHEEVPSETRLKILSSIPETIPPTNYEFLLPREGKYVVAHWREEDWAETFYKEITSGYSDDDSEIDSDIDLDFEDEVKEKVSGSCPSDTFTAERLTEWYLGRIREIDTKSGQLQNALLLCELGMKFEIQDLEVMYKYLNDLHKLVYSTGLDIYLDEYEQKTDFERLCLVLGDSTPGTIMEHLNDKERAGLYLDNDPTLLHQYMKHVSTTKLEIAAEIISNTQPTSLKDKQSRDLEAEMDLIDVALDCVYTYEGVDKFDCMNEILKCLPARGENLSNKPAMYDEYHTKVDNFEHHLLCSQKLSKYNTGKPLSFFLSDPRDAEYQKLGNDVLDMINRKAVRHKPPHSDKGWKDVLDDLKTLRDYAFPFISRQTCFLRFLDSLLSAKRFKLARDLLNDANAAPLKDEQLREAVMKNAQEYFNSATNQHDRALEDAKECLSLVVLPDEKIRGEMDLIDAVKQLEAFDVTVVPLEVRLSQERQSFIKKALNASEIVYRERSALLKCGKMMGLSSKREQCQLNVLIAKSAHRAGDAEFVYEVCMDLMKEGFTDAWEICADVAKNAEFQRIQKRLDLMGHTIWSCPEDSLDEQLSQWKQATTEDIATKLDVPYTNSLPKFPDVSEEEWMEYQDQLTNADESMISVYVYAHDPDAPAESLIAQCFGEVSVSDSEDETDYDREIDDESDDEKHVSFVKSDDSVPRMHELSLLLGCAGIWDSNDLNRARKYNIDKLLIKLADISCVPQTLLSQSYLLSLQKATFADEVIKNALNGKLSKHKRRDIIELAFRYFTNEAFVYLRGHSPTGNRAIQLSDVDLFSSQMRTLKLPESPATLDVSFESEASIEQIPMSVEEYLDDISFQTRDSDSNDVLKELLDLATHYCETLRESEQTSLVLSVCPNVDVYKITHNSSYRNKILTNLIQSTKPSNVTAAIKLCEKFDIPTCEVRLKHVKWLFQNVEDITVAQNLLSNQQPHLCSPQYALKLGATLENSVLPVIDGHDFERLICYYELYERALKSLPNSKSKPVFKTHIQILRRLEGADVRLDYKRLLNGNAAIEELELVTTEENVKLLGMLAKKIADIQSSSSVPSLTQSFVTSLFLNSKLRFCEMTEEGVEKWFEAHTMYFPKLSIGDAVSVLSHFSDHMQDADEPISIESDEKGSLKLENDKKKLELKARILALSKGLEILGHSIKKKSTRASEKSMRSPAKTKTKGKRVDWDVQHDRIVSEFEFLVVLDKLQEFNAPHTEGLCSSSEWSTMQSELRNLVPNSSLPNLSDLLNLIQQELDKHKSLYRGTLPDQHVSNLWNIDSLFIEFVNSLLRRLSDPAAVSVLVLPDNQQTSDAHDHDETKHEFRETSPKELTISGATDLLQRAMLARVNSLRDDTVRQVVTDLGEWSLNTDVAFEERVVILELLHDWQKSNVSQTAVSELAKTQAVRLPQLECHKSNKVLEMFQFKKRHIDQNDLSSPQKRHQIFEDLLQEICPDESEVLTSDILHGLHGISELLAVWTRCNISDKSEEDPNDYLHNAWKSLANRIIYGKWEDKSGRLNHGTRQEASLLLLQIFQGPAGKEFDEQYCLDVYERCSNILPAEVSFKIGLLCEHDFLVRKTIDHIIRSCQPTQESSTSSTSTDTSSTWWKRIPGLSSFAVKFLGCPVDIDDQLSLLILTTGLQHMFVGTSVFPILSKYLLENKNEQANEKSTFDYTTALLVNHHHYGQATSLLQLFLGIQSRMRSVTYGLKLLKKFLKHRLKHYQNLQNLTMVDVFTKALQTIEADQL